MARGSSLINTVTKDLKQYQTGVIIKIRKLVIDSLTRIEIMAQRSLNTHSYQSGESLNFIVVQKKISEGGLQGEVGVMGSDPLPAYIEFGTGLFAADILAPYPQWIKDIAMTFYVNGQGTLQGKPYLYNNFLIVKIEFEKKLQEILDQEVKS
ncbi:hypothetical protein HX021_08380 [Sphingobacterium sp. N143]|uniref:hypothetical protein n=1 Tax=Sphingobacterium sp. N143 TaxID=2746727 RepID=UPI0025787DA1|nr:hypothetical protein [Sphingobacterium sp. N143]MDM1294314.1 hypothetical protein [Sphingobacterium sp. N143]